MAGILQIYEDYKISRLLQLHQLRVAAAAKQICDSLTVPIDNQTVITACLLHDMGNVLKFDFSVDPSFFEPEGVDYWKKVQAEVAARYGTDDEHQVSLMIARELKVSPAVLDCIESVDFGKALQNLDRREFEPKICNNADLRVGPHGVISVQQRLQEGKERYQGRTDKWVSEDAEKELHQAIFKLQDQIFAVSKSNRRILRTSP